MTRVSFDWKTALCLVRTIKMSSLSAVVYDVKYFLMAFKQWVMGVY